MVEQPVTFFFLLRQLSHGHVSIFYLPVHHRSLGTRASQFFHLHPWKVKPRERTKVSYIDTEYWVNNSAIWDIFRVHYQLISLISHVIHNFIMIILGLIYRHFEPTTAKYNQLFEMGSFCS